MQCLVNSKYSIILKLSCPGDCLIFKFPCFLPRNGSGKRFRYIMLSTQHNGFQAKQAAKKNLKYRSVESTIHALLLPPQEAFVAPPVASSLSPISLFAISSLSLESESFQLPSRLGIILLGSRAELGDRLHLPAILSRGFLDGVEEAGTEEDEAIVQASKLTMKEQALGERRERRDPV